MPAVVGINGIRTHGERNIDLLLHELHIRDVPVRDVQLPYRHWMSARWGGRHDGHIVAENSNDGDILVAHSYGAVRAYYAQRLREYKAIVCIAPAASRNTEWNNPGRVWCYYSPSDWVVSIGSRLPLHVFGAAGNFGFADPRVHNIEMKSSHGGYFDAQLGMLQVIAKQVELLYSR